MQFWKNTKWKILVGNYRNLNALTVAVGKQNEWMDMSVTIVLISRWQWHWNPLTLKWGIFYTVGLTEKTILCITNVPANICLFKVNNRNTKKWCAIRSKLTTKTPERRHYRQWHRSGVFIINLEHISHLFLVFLLLTLFVSWGVRILYVIWNYCSRFSEIKILCGKNLYGVFSNAEMCPFHIKN